MGHRVSCIINKSCSVNGVGVARKSLIRWVARVAGIPVPGSRDDDAASSGPKRLPQAIAHRGYKVVAPENSMLAFRAAAEVGAHAIETDLHLSKDGVVVLSHDGTLKRCFGEDTKVKDRDWKYLSTLRTVRKPAQPMPRLLDLLEYLNQPGLEHVWVMLDIKVNNTCSYIGLGTRLLGSWRG